MDAGGAKAVGAAPSKPRFGRSSPGGRHPAPSTAPGAPPAGAVVTAVVAIELCDVMTCMCDGETADVGDVESAKGEAGSVLGLRRSGEEDGGLWLCGDLEPHLVVMPYSRYASSVASMDSRSSVASVHHSLPRGESFNVRVHRLTW